MKFWEAAEDFSQLLGLNRKFLSGQIPGAPYHRGPIDKETNPLLFDLLKLHDFGLLTTRSQPYRYEVIPSDKEWTEVQQNPYVSFAMPGQDTLYLEFFEKLRERADIVVFAAELCPYRVVDGSHGAHVAIRVRTANTKEDLEASEWRLGESTCVDKDMSGQFDWLYRKVEKLVYFDVAAREFGPPVDLLGVIEDVALTSGLTRMS